MTDTAYLTATDATFDEVTSTGKPVLIDFWATWCGPCRQVTPIVEKIASERDDVTIVKVDVDEAPAAAQRFGVRGVPTLVMLDATGTITAIENGAKPRPAIEALIATAQA